MNIPQHDVILSGPRLVIHESNEVRSTLDMLNNHIVSLFISLYFRIYPAMDLQVVIDIGNELC